MYAEERRGSPREPLVNATRPSGERSGGGGGFGLLADTDVRPSSPAAAAASGRQPQHREGGGGGLISERVAGSDFSDRDQPRDGRGDGHAGLMGELASADKPRSRDASPAGARLDARPSSLHRDVMERDINRSGSRSDSLDPVSGRLKASDPGGYGLLADERRSSGGGLDFPGGRGAEKPVRDKSEEESYGLFADAGQKSHSFPAKDLRADIWRDRDRDEDRIAAPYSPRAEAGSPSRHPAGRKASEGVSAAGLLDNLRMRPPGRSAAPGGGIGGKSQPAGNPRRGGADGSGSGGGGRGSLDAYGQSAEDQWGGLEGREGSAPLPYVKSSSFAGAQGKLPSNQPVLQVDACPLVLQACPLISNLI